MSSAEQFPEELIVRLKRVQALRYGENPHQDAALYEIEGGDSASVVHAKQVQGKELSFNNINDADAALECVSEFSEPACVIVKHMNPCGVGLGENSLVAYQNAFQCDPVSAFGGIVALNTELTEQTAVELVKIFLEVVIAPSAGDAALAILSAKPNVRVLLTGTMPDPKRKLQILRSVRGGVLASSSDNTVFGGELQTVTKRAPTARELSDLIFSFTVAKHVKSNAIVYARNGATVGIGAGQMSRIYSAKIAALKAEEASLGLSGAVMASDAFMPFPDCIELAGKHGITAVIQPGGSQKDQDSIDAANTAGMAMVFTGIRHFRH